MNALLRFVRRSPVIFALSVLILVVAVSAFTWKNESDYYYKLNTSLELFGQVYREIAQNYVDEVDPEEFIAAGIQGMLKELDPYTVYMRKRESSDIDLLTSGYYGGVGITVGFRDSAVTIVDVVDGYSAQHEGVRIGDKIASIDGVELLHGPLDRLREYTRGEPSTILRMTVLREGATAPLTFELTRENIRVRSISYSDLLNGDIGYIRLDRFGTNAGEEMRAAIVDLEHRGRLSGLILDLRDNPGGLLESAVDVASKFVPAGSVIVTTRGRDSSEERTYRSVEEPIASGLPLVVLVNGGSASAAEIVAGAIQDLDNGIILGEQSFGKGLVQSVRRLPHDATLKMTTARYFTPSGRCIQKIDYKSGRFGAHLEADTAHAAYRTKMGRLVYGHGGILPDTVVEGEDSLTLAEQLRRDDLYFNFATRYTAGLKVLPAGFRVDDDLFRSFQEYALTAMYSTSGKGSVLSDLHDLQAAALREGFSHETLQKIESVKGDILADERRSLERNRDAIARELYGEIVGRFGGQRERIAVTLPGDRQVTAAIGLLRSGRGDYTRLLSIR